MRRQLAGTVELSFSLLDQGLLTDILADPTRIRQEIAARDLRETVICTDEIQKCPALMDEVHSNARASTCSAGAAATG